MPPLSRGARLCEAIIRASRPHRGGARVCGRRYLARRLACTPRTVSRYVAELRRAGRLEVTPPPRRRTPRGWRSIGTNTYRLPHPVNHSPHIPRSTRGDSPVTSSPIGEWVGRTADHTGPPLDPGPATARMLATLGLGHAGG